MKNGILLIGGSDPVITSKAKAHKLALAEEREYALPFEKTLILQIGTRVPWDLLPAAWHFLERWDCAAPLYRYGVTAEDLGSKAEQELTRAIVRDLRVLVHSYELLFVRKNETGAALIALWKEELSRGSEKRLAFLRAYYQIKPRLCVLPVSWLAEVRDQSQAFARRRAGRRHSRRPAQAGAVKLVEVQIGPGRFVKCAPGDVERVKQFYKDQARKRG